MKKIALALFLLLASSLCRADDPPAAPRSLEALQALAASLHYQQGTISLKRGLATVTLPGDFRYLSPDDTDIVLHKMWGNPQGPKTLGMIVPSEQSVLNPRAWAVVITYNDDGYIKDSDA